MLDLFRDVTIAVELMVAGAALRVVFLAARHGYWIGVLRGAALMTFVIDAIWITHERIGNSHLDWTTVLNLVASVAAIIGFGLAEIRVRQGKDRFY